MLGDFEIGNVWPSECVPQKILSRKSVKKIMDTVCNNQLFKKIHGVVITQADFYWKEKQIFQPSSRYSFHEKSYDFCQTYVFNLKPVYIKDTSRTKCRYSFC